MIKQDLAAGNPWQWVEDMADRYRFSTNHEAQQEFVGGPVTRQNMPMVIKSLYGGIPSNYKGSIFELFNHDKLDPDHCRLANYGGRKEFHYSRPPSDKRLHVKGLPEIYHDGISEAGKVWHARNGNVKPDEVHIELDNNYNNLQSSCYCAMQTVEKNMEVQ